MSMPIISMKTFLLIFPVTIALKIKIKNLTYNDTRTCCLVLFMIRLGKHSSKRKLTHYKQLLRLWYFDLFPTDIKKKKNTFKKHTCTHQFQAIHSNLLNRAKSYPFLRLCCRYEWLEYTGYELKTEFNQLVSRSSSSLLMRTIPSIEFLKPEAM